MLETTDHVAVWGIIGTAWQGTVYRILRNLEAVRAFACADPCLRNLDCRRQRGMEFQRPRLHRRIIPPSPPEKIEKSGLEIPRGIPFGQTKTELTKEFQG
jgi:hypothetical protein